nr:hypothetical protein [Angustibacter aerolatus]
MAQQPRRPRPARRPRRRLLGEHLAAQIAARADWGRGLSPRRVAHHLAPFEAAGWTAADWFTVADTILTGTRLAHQARAPARTKPATSTKPTSSTVRRRGPPAPPPSAPAPACTPPAASSTGSPSAWTPAPTSPASPSLGDGHDASGATARLEAGHAGDARTACSRPDCDGHGWLDVDGPATPCPDCPPTARAPHVDLAEARRRRAGSTASSRLDPPF